MPKGPLNNVHVWTTTTENQMTSNNLQCKE